MKTMDISQNNVSKYIKLNIRIIKEINYHIITEINYPIKQVLAASLITHVISKQWSVQMIFQAFACLKHVLIYPAFLRDSFAG